MEILRPTTIESAFRLREQQSKQRLTQIRPCRSHGFARLTNGTTRTVVKHKNDTYNSHARVYCWYYAQHCSMFRAALAMSRQCARRMQSVIQTHTHTYTHTRSTQTQSVSERLNTAVTQPHNTQRSRVCIRTKAAARTRALRKSDKEEKHNTKVKWTNQKKSPKQMNISEEMMIGRFSWYGQRRVSQPINHPASQQCAQ